MPVDAGLASLSDNLLLAAIAAYVVAMFGYTVEYAFGRRSTIPAKKVAPARVLAGAGGPDQVEDTTDPVEETTDEAIARLTAPPAPLRSRATGPAARFGWVGVAATAAGALLQLGCLIARGAAAHRFPLGNMYEFVSAVCIVGVVAWLVLAVRKP
ncbi:MAG TPA: c-type cytochrome biogenesis protein CcsB, partial [Kribbellaceae bacterium]